MKQVVQSFQDQLIGVTRQIDLEKDSRMQMSNTFKMFEEKAYEMGFKHAAVGAMVRSSYHADQQAHGASLSR